MQTAQGSPYWRTTCCSASGSRQLASSVKPTMFDNSAVSCRRSPSASSTVAAEPGYAGPSAKASAVSATPPSKDLLAQLDPSHFAQVHRSVVVNLRAIRRVTRGDNETADIELKGRSERLPVSRSYLGLFKEM